MENDKKTPKRLYKYRDFSHRTLAMVISDNLYYAYPSTFNDPLDSRPSLKADLDVAELEMLLRSTSRGRQTGGTTHASLDSMGPVPDEPSVYPVGSEYYLVPITFEIELLDRAAQQSAEATAVRDATQEGDPS